MRRTGWLDSTLAAPQQWTLYLDGCVIWYRLVAHPLCHRVDTPLLRDGRKLALCMAAGAGHCSCQTIGQSLPAPPLEALLWYAAAVLFE